MTVSTQSALEERLGAYFAGRPAALADPYPLFREVRETARVLPFGPMVLLTHYDDVKLALRDAARFGNRAQSEGSRAEAARAALDPEALAAYDEVIGFQTGFPSRNDGAVHARLRRIAHRAFTPRRIAELEQATRRYVDELLVPWSDGGVVDAMSLAYRVPLMVVGDLLGVPASDRDLIHGWSLALGAGTASTERGAILAARDATRRFRAYVAEMLEELRDAPARTDLAATLLDAEEGERLDADELAALIVQLLFAGHETTTNLIGIGLFELLRNPDEWARLTAEPALVPDAVEELLRYVTPVQFASRLALADVEIDGVVVPRGSTVIPLLGAAHRDPAAFPDPDALDIGRPERSQHLAFGFGPHFCLGAALARLEAQVALGTVARRFPGLEPAAARLEWTGGAMLRHLAALPVSPGAERRS